MKKIVTILSLFCCSILAFGQMDIKHRDQLFDSLKKLYNASPAEGCRLLKIEKTTYLVSFVSMDNSNFASPAQMHRIAQVKSARNTGEFVSGVKTASQTDIIIEESDGNYTSKTVDKIRNIVATNVKGMESLGYFDGPDNTTIFVYITTVKPDK